MPLEVFGDNYSKISMLFSYWQVGHDVVIIYIVVSNVSNVLLSGQTVRLISSKMLA